MRNLLILLIAIFSTLSFTTSAQVTNFLGLDSFLIEPVTINHATDSYFVSIHLINYTNTVIDSVKVSWAVNGKTQKDTPDFGAPVTITPHLSKKFKIGTFVFLDTGNYSFKSWLVYKRNPMDIERQDDTVYFNIHHLSNIAPSVTGSTGFCASFISGNSIKINLVSPLSFAGECVLIDSKGQILSKSTLTVQKGENEYYLDIRQLPSQIYFLALFGDKYLDRVKLIKP